VFWELTVAALVSDADAVPDLDPAQEEVSHVSRHTG